MFLIIRILHWFILIIIFPKGISIIIEDFYFPTVIQLGNTFGSINLFGNISVATIDLTGGCQHAFIIVIVIIYAKEIVDITGKTLCTASKTDCTNRTVFHKPSHHINIMNSLIQQMVTT